MAGRTVALVVATALFMENLDGSIISSALPAIAASINESPLSLKLALTSYMISLALFIPLSGWIADRYGARRVFAAAIVVFLAGSVACTLAANLEGFVMARALQGAGGAMMVPVGRLVVIRGTAKSDLVNAMTWLTVPALLGPVSGPLIGGAIVTYGDWRWIFLINVPIGLVGIALALWLIPDDGRRDTRRLDRAGFGFSAITLVSLMLGTITAERLGVESPFVIALLMLGGLFGWLTIRHSRSVEQPLLDLRLLELQTYRAVIIAGSLFRIGVGAIPFLLPLLLQLGFGLSPLQSGLVTFVAALGALVMKPVNARLLYRYGFRSTLSANAVLAAASIAAIALFTPATPLWFIYPVLFIGGCLRSLQFTSLNALAFAEIDRDRTSSATSLSAVAQQVSLSFGVTVAVAALDASQAIGGGATLVVGDFSFAFIVVAFVSLLSAPLFLRLPPNAVAEIAGRLPPADSRMPASEAN